MSKKYIEPEYLVLTKDEKRNITKRLLILPICCLLFLVVMTIGELDATSSVPSFTKMKYFFESNRIVGEFCNGDTDSVIAHNLSYFDNGTINYVYYSGVQDIYDGGASLLEEIYETFFKDELVISFVGIPRAQYQTHLNKFLEDSDKSYIWRSIGYIYVGNKDVLQVDIQFLSPEIYYIFLSPTLPELENATDDEIKMIEDYKQSPEYALLKNTQEYLYWIYNTASSQSEDSIKYIENVFLKQNLSATLLQQFITRYFTNKGAYLNQEFTEEILVNYQNNLAWMLYSLACDVSVDDSMVSYGMYDKTTKAISLSLVLNMSDSNHKKAQMTIPVLYTPAGYQIIPDNIFYLAEEGFLSDRPAQLIEFLKYDKMPEDVLWERAKYELNSKR